MPETAETLKAGARREIELPGGVRMAFRGCPAGEFRMGQRGEFADEEPVHRVVIPEAFWMGETPVTQAQFAVWKPEHENGFPGNPDHPAEQMTWDEARDFAQWLTRESGDGFPEGGLIAGLPDEARWEYACRAGTETVYHSGDGEDALAADGWYQGNADGKTHPVGEKLPNAWGLHDLHGNVWEWCRDVFDEGAYRKRLDGSDVSPVETDGPFRVLRGGSWFNSAWYCRAAYRDWGGPSDRLGNYGFRLCLARRSPAQDSRPEAAPGGRARRDAAARPDEAAGGEEREGKLSKRPA